MALEAHISQALGACAALSKEPIIGGEQNMGPPDTKRSRERIGELRYLEVLERHGVRTTDQFRSTDKARACYRELAAFAAKEAA